MVPKASHTHSYTLIAFAIGPDFVVACAALDLAVACCDFGPRIG
jgi:hypothetical protein